MAPPADAIDWTDRPQNVAFTAFQWGEEKKTLTYTHRARWLKGNSYQSGTQLGDSHHYSQLALLWP